MANCDKMNEALRLLNEAIEQLKAVEWEVSIGTIADIEKFIEQNTECKQKGTENENN